MKTCAVCQTSSDPNAATCGVCGEASWSEAVSEQTGTTQELNTDATATDTVTEKPKARRR